MVYYFLAFQLSKHIMQLKCILCTQLVPLSRLSYLSYQGTLLPSEAQAPPAKANQSFPTRLWKWKDKGRSFHRLLQDPADLYRLHDGTYQLLSSEPNYAIFSNTAYTDDDVSGHQNIENLHNGIHAFVGGTGGHMSSIPFSSFDPIFWLHHTYVGSF